MNQTNFKTEKYFALAVDPVHVGTGGYRLGHVDNTIMRDMPTGLPKIPGTSISGVARAYLAMDQNRPGCAGKGGEQGENHCGDKDCPVCVAFGFSKGKIQKSLHGMAQFFDAQILFFPVHSIVGPVWVTSPSALKMAGATNIPTVADEKALTKPKANINWEGQSATSLGWLFIESENMPANFDFAIPGFPASHAFMKTVLDHLVVVSDAFFTSIVNDNLEIRTSVAIDPYTGAAEEGALFTFEAIPRGTIFFFECAYNNPKHFKAKGEDIPHDIQWVQENVEKGLEYIAELGVGGMNTRGLGRVKLLKD
jgi:CRISPR-associated protein Cmr4